LVFGSVKLKNDEFLRLTKGGEIVCGSVHNLDTRHDEKMCSLCLRRLEDRYLTCGRRKRWRKPRKIVRFSKSIDIISLSVANQILHYHMKIF